MKLEAFASSFSFFTFAPLVFALNDWSKPCFDGVCNYDVQQTSTSMAGSMTIRGSPYSVSDITPAAGWHIINCTSSTNAQTINVVCMDSSMGCSHLFQKGAQNTVIRLPEGCGKGPFARVANYWIPSNQTLPASMAATLRKRDEPTPQVHALRLDANFDQVPASNGNVTLTIVGSTIPGVTGNASLVPPAPSRRRMRDLHSRSLFTSLDSALSGGYNVAYFDS